MEKYNKQNQKNIQALFEQNTGVHLPEQKKLNYGKRSFVVGMIVCFLSLSGFAFTKLSGLEGDDRNLGFLQTYLGNGVFEIIVVNGTDKNLKLQNQVKLMRWSTAEEVEGNGKNVIVENSSIAAHSSGKIIVDLSKGYDVEELEKELPKGDGYYLILTNNYFAFGQDWMCDLNFEKEDEQPASNSKEEDRIAAKVDELMNKMEEAEKARQENETAQAGTYADEEAILRNVTWCWPTISRKISDIITVEDIERIKAYSQRKMELVVAEGEEVAYMYISGAKGDDIYAVTAGTVVEAGWSSGSGDGNCILLDIGDGMTVRYGHLNDINVKVGDKVEQGTIIAALGQSGIATGPCLLFEVYENGKLVNPLFAEVPE